MPITTSLISWKHAGLHSLPYPFYGSHTCSIKGERTERTFSLARDKIVYTSCAILGLYQGQVVGLKEQGHHPGIAQVDLSMTLPG